MKKKSKNSVRKKSTGKLKAEPAAHAKEADKTFLIAIISIVAVVALFLLLLFSGQFVGKAIAVNAAGAELVSPAYAGASFSLKIVANTEKETTSVQFTLELPSEMDCSDVATTPAENLIAGWDEFENKCDSSTTPKRIIFYAQKKISTPTGETELFDIAQIDFVEGLPLNSMVQFTFKSFLALDKDSENLVQNLPLPLTVTVQEAPSTAVCGNGGEPETGEQCDDGNNVTESCSIYGQCEDICDASCKLVTVQGLYCGDGIINGNEQCDSTSSSCINCKVVLTATCGDNICDVKQESTASCPLDCGEVCPTNNLISWWKAENDAKDNSISGYHGTAQSIAYEQGVVGKAFKFDGASSIDLGSKVGTLFSDPTGNSLSISFWMKTNALKSTSNGTMYILDSGAATGGRRGIYCNTKDGDLSCAIQQQSAIYQASISKAIPLNSWKLVTLTFNDNTKELKLYLDGSFSKDGVQTQLPGETYVSEEVVVIGATTTKQLLFKGLLDEISVWDRALTAAEVDSLFDAGTTGMCAKPTSVCGNGDLEAGEECDDENNDDGDNCSSICLTESAICGDNVCEIKFESTTSCKQDCGLVCPTDELVSWWRGENEKDSFSSHHGTLGGDATSVLGKVDHAFSFDGEGDYFTLGQKPGTIFSDPTGESLSVSFWMKTNAAETPSGAQYIIDSGAGAASRRGFYCNTQKGKLNCVIKHDENIYEVIADAVVPLNVWKFVTFTFDNAKGELKLYVDGNVAATGTKAALSSSYQPVPASVIGATSLQTLSFSGLLDEIAVWNRALTSAEVKSIFDTGNIGMCAVPGAVCGNGFMETGEECDDGNVISTDACTSECKIAVCGDGMIRTGFEQCDGSNVGNVSCQSLGFANGSLSCTVGCTYNNTACMAAPEPVPLPPATTLTVNGTKISLGELAPANDTFSTLLTATEGFSQKIMIYTILYGADGKVLKLESDELTGGMNKDAWLVVTANHLQTEVKKKAVIVFDKDPNPTVYGKLERSYS